MTTFVTSICDRDTYKFLAKAIMSAVEAPRTRTLHSKRSFGKYPKLVESPAYDASVSVNQFTALFIHLSDVRSEEDNDPLTDDAHSATGVSVPIVISRHSSTSNNPRNSHLRPTSAFRGKHHLAHNLVSDSDGVDSPTYDGDIESSTTAGADGQTSHKLLYHHHSASSNSTINTTPNPTPSIEPPNPISLLRSTNPASHHPVFISPPMSTYLPPQIATDALAAAEAVFNPAALTPEDIQSFVAKAIAGESKRGYKINPPPVGRPVRIYADGMFRQASFLLPFLITQ